MNAIRSRYTPSNMPPKLLEALFVAREPLLGTLLSRIQTAATSSERNHSLIVGRRGAGKTHLLSLTHSRLDELIQGGLPAQPAWLDEDPYLIASYHDMLVEIICALDRTAPPAAEIDELERLLNAIYAEDGLIVVLCENFDDILHAITKSGQGKLRHFLQSEPTLLLVATTTAVSRDLADEASPFFGFFTTTDLPQLTVSQAQEMLVKIATSDGDRSLVNYLKTEEGLSRLRAIEHLAGGQPRIWAVLAGALTAHGLSELVEVLATEIDLLTPYYQEQLGRLSPQQRRIVLQLAEIQHAVSVGELAANTGIDERSLAAALAELRDRRWVMLTTSPFTVWVDRRRRFYEITEPLARLAFQTKRSRGVPVPLIVEFMKTWFDPGSLSRQDRTELDPGYRTAFEQPLDGNRIGIVRMLHGLPETRALGLPLLSRVDTALHELTFHDPVAFFGLPTSVRMALEDQIDAPESDAFEHSIDAVRSRVFEAATSELPGNSEKQLGKWIDNAERWLGATTQRAVSLRWYAKLLGVAGEFEQAVQAIEAIERIVEPDDPMISEAWTDLASSHASAGQFENSLLIFDKVARDRSRYLESQHPDVASAKHQLATALVAVGEREGGLEAGRDAVAIYRGLADENPAAYLPNLALSLNTLSVLLGEVGEREAGLEASREAGAIRRVLVDQNPAAYLPDLASSLSNLSVLLGEGGEHGAGLEAIREAVAIYRGLVLENPAAYQPALAASLQVLAAYE